MGQNNNNNNDNVVVSPFIYPSAVHTVMDNLNIQVPYILLDALCSSAYPQLLPLCSVVHTSPVYHCQLSKKKSLKTIVSLKDVNKVAL